MNRNIDNASSLQSLPLVILIRGSQVLIQDCDQVGLPTTTCLSIGTDLLSPGPSAIARYTTISSRTETMFPPARWAQVLIEDTSTPLKSANRCAMGAKIELLTLGLVVIFGVKLSFSLRPLAIFGAFAGEEFRHRREMGPLSPGEQVTSRSHFAA